MSSKKQGRRLPLGVGYQIRRGKIRPNSKSRRFQVMLHKARNIGVIFQHKNGLAQPV